MESWIELLALLDSHMTWLTNGDMADMLVFEIEKINKDDDNLRTSKSYDVTNKSTR